MSTVAYVMYERARTFFARFIVKRKTNRRGSEKSSKKLKIFDEYRIGWVLDVKSLFNAGSNDTII